MREIAARVEFDSPIGRIAVAATDKGLASVDIAPFTKPLGQFHSSDFARDIALGAKEQLHGYFESELHRFDLPLDIQGTEFQRMVWEEISQTGFGHQISYREIAQKIGKPLASRAVGGAVGANPLPIVIGCHRVMGTSGKLTGYSGGEGLKTKRWLLEHEGLSYK